MAAELDKLLETLSAMHKTSITVDEDVTTIFGVPIEIDDSIVNEYEIILKCG